MTDIPQPPTTMLDCDACLKQARERARIAAELLPANKKALFDVPSAAGIATITLWFDGSGDSGQIEEIEAHAAGTEIARFPSAQSRSPGRSGTGLD